MNIDSIKNGFVIDHIDAGKGMLIYEKLELNKKTEALYRDRYEAGSVSLKDYLESRKSRRATDLAVCKSMQNSLNDTVVFAKALGGL